MTGIRMGLWTAALLAVLLIPQTSTATERSLSMEVGEQHRKLTSCAMEEAHNWFIRCPLADRESGITGMTVLQTLPTGLALDSKSVAARLTGEGGVETLLVMGVHYEVTAGCVYVEQGSADRFCLAITEEGMAFLNTYRDRQSELLISYQAEIRSDAPVGIYLTASAQMNLTDAEGNKTVLLSDKASVITGGISILLTNGSAEPIEGGAFMLARAAEPAELEVSEGLELLDIGEDIIPVVFVRFRTLDQEGPGKADVALSDGQGRLKLLGIAFGTYYLVQIENSENVLPSEPISITVDEVSHLTAEDGWRKGNGVLIDNTVLVKNSHLLMPKTGGMGTLPFTVGGGTVILCACGLMLNNRKRKKRFLMLRTGIFKMDS